ncbi:hypothetical protein V500_05319, partial [Pseudogymnoascus sp. VKM F-4518 (FW-2643)]
HIDAHFASKAHKLERSKRRRIADEVAEINGLIGNEETLARRLPEENALQCTLPIAGPSKASKMCHGGVASTASGFLYMDPNPGFSRFNGRRVSSQAHRRCGHGRREGRREIKEADEHREPNPWLGRVGWAAHLAGLDRAEIRGWVEMPDDDEPGLQTVCKAFDWMIREAQYITVQEVVGQAALFEVHRKEVTEEAQCHLTLLCYVFRAEREKPEDRPAYRLTERQNISMHGLQAIVQEFQVWKNEQSSDVSSVSSVSGVESEAAVTDEGEEGESDEEIAFMKRIQREVLRFCIDLLNHPLQDNEYKSVIISGLAVLGIRDDDGWLSAEDYTSKYSAIAKLARLMVVHEGYEQRQEEIKRKTEANERQENRLTAEQIGEAARSYFHYIRRLTYQFMTMAHDGRDPTPMQWIYKALGGGQHFVSADSVQHGPGPFDGSGVGSRGTRGVVWEVDM